MRDQVWHSSELGYFAYNDEHNHFYQKSFLCHGKDIVSENW